MTPSDTAMIPVSSANTATSYDDYIAQEDEQFRKSPDEFFYRLKAKVVDYFGAHSGKEVADNSELME